MKLFFASIIISLSLNGFCHGQHHAMIGINYLGNVDIFDKPNGRIIKKLKNDSINEDFLSLEILKQTKTHFYVKISPTIKPELTYGWVKKANYIGAYIKNENYPMDLKLYKKKSESDNDQIIYQNWKPDLLTIEKYDGDWIYVSNIQNGIKYKGWIKKERLCANPYSTCS